MKKNLQIINTDNKLMLRKSKSLISITNNILSKDHWMQRLWDWADKNNIPDYGLYPDYYAADEIYMYGIPRKKNDLIRLTELSLRPECFPGFVHGKKYKINLPKEIKNLINLTELALETYDKIKLPKEIGELINLKLLILMSFDFLELPKEIGNLINLNCLDLDCYKNLDVPKEIAKLKNLKELYLRSDGLLTIPKEIGNLMNLDNLKLACYPALDVPKEIGSLIQLKILSLWSYDSLVKIPKEIINLTNLTSLEIRSNNNLVLTAEQKEWISKLIHNRCSVVLDKDNKNLADLYELARRYKYLDEFNVGRKVPILTEILDNDIPFTINDRLANSEITFEEYLDEVSEYLDKEQSLGKEKFDELIKKIYDRDYDLGECFERNITFQSFHDNKLTWGSHAEGTVKKILIDHWGLINKYVKDTFGYETKIVNIALNK